MLTSQKILVIDIYTYFSSLNGTGLEVYGKLLVGTSLFPIKIEISTSHQLSSF